MNVQKSKLFNLSLPYTKRVSTVLNILCIVALWWISITVLTTFFICNITTSAPRGFYVKHAVSQGSLKKGTSISFCPPNKRKVTYALKRGYVYKGNCSYGGLRFLKTVVATEGDTVRVTKSGITVNGYRIPHTRQRITDSKGRRLRRFRYTGKVPKNFLLTVSTRKNGFDSRYYGFVPLKSIESSVTPFLTESLFC